MLNGDRKLGTPLEGRPFAVWRIPDRPLIKRQNGPYASGEGWHSVQIPSPALRRAGVLGALRLKTGRLPCANEC